MSDKVFRRLCLVFLLFLVLLFVFDIYLDAEQFFIPCYMDHVERIINLVLALLFFMGFMHHAHTTVTKRFYGGVIFIFGSLGALVAGRHLWLQSNASTAVFSRLSVLTPKIQQSMSLKQLLILAFQGTADCAKVQWTGPFGITFTGITFLCFLLMVFVGLIFLVLSHRKV